MVESIARTARQIGAVVRRRRRALGLTQSALGEKAGMRQATISALENGEQVARLKTLFDVLSALGAEIVVRERKKSSLSFEDIL